jgi:signal transduction histidine kinase
LQEKTHALQAEIEEHKRTETLLELEIAESKRKEQIIERTHQELMVASRQAGQAEVASSVLHNVGNVLNSVSVATSLIADHLHRLHAAGLAKAVKLLQGQADLGAFFRSDPRGTQFLPYLDQWAAHFESEKSCLLAEVKDLDENVGHVKEIVAMHQNYTKVSGLTEKLAVPEVVETAVKMHSGSLAERSIALQREYEEVPPVLVDKHKFLQILANLLLNAKQACDESGLPDKQIVIRIKSLASQRIAIEVADNGVGIPPENLTRIFAQGFTTRKDGHGFGLHSAALAANEMNGTLEAYSEGLGQGARFILELPVAPAGK